MLAGPVDPILVSVARNVARNLNKAFPCLLSRDRIVALFAALHAPHHTRSPNRAATATTQRPCHRRINASGAANLFAIVTSRYAGAMNIFATLPKNLGMMLLAVWLILFGVLTAPFLKFHFAHSGDLLALLAIIAGVLLLIKR